MNESIEIMEVATANDVMGYCFIGFIATVTLLLLGIGVVGLIDYIRRWRMVSNHVNTHIRNEISNNKIGKK